MRDEASGSPQAAPEGFASWPAYWKAQGAPWRKQPEIDEAQRRFLAQRRMVTPDIEHGRYPFRDERGSISLTRADIEWLLATHDDGLGANGPVTWRGESAWRPDGIDVRGADLAGENLSNLPLTRLLASLRFDEWMMATEAQREAAAVHLEFCVLREVHLEGANLRSAHLEGALLRDAHLQGVRLHGAHLEGANLAHAHLEGARLNYAHLGGIRFPAAVLEQVRQRVPVAPTQLPPASLRLAYFDATTNLERTDIGNRDDGWAALADVQWNSANLTVVAWSSVGALGDEQEARVTCDIDGKPKRQATRLQEFKDAVRANRQLVTVLRSQGMHEDADRFAYKAQKLQRQVARRQGRWDTAFGSWLLDVVAGYGYKPIRSVITYLLVILTFAAAYFALTNFGMPPFLSSHSSPLAWYEALVLSVSSFHGRGLFPTWLSLGDPIAILAAFEAIFGLLIEITFIATFTQRFFAR